jgi:hypothetical protein
MKSLTLTHRTPAIGVGLLVASPGAAAAEPRARRSGHACRLAVTRLRSEGLVTSIYLIPLTERNTQKGVSGFTSPAQTVPARREVR